MEVRLALLGNPNIGKSSLFNRLTGLNQRVGNFSGVTIEKKTGTFSANDVDYQITDLPGTYSLIPKSPDEEVVLKEILKQKDEFHAYIVVADASNLERNLLLFSQVADLGVPVVLALSMADIAEQKGIKIDEKKLEAWLGCPVVAINPRLGSRVDELIQRLPEAAVPKLRLFNLKEALEENLLCQQMPSYRTWLAWAGGQPLPEEANIKKAIRLSPSLAQAKETVYRYKKVKEGFSLIQTHTIQEEEYRFRFDRIALHPILGYVLMFFALLSVFEVIFYFSEWPTTAIEWSVGQLATSLERIIPEGMLRNLIVQGMLAGIQGVVVFIPQIALLFFLIGIMEESGYMARIMILLDRFMHKLGLSGKSIIPLVSGVACAVPAIMATRNMANTRERMIAIFITPLMSCSARLPVFTLLVAMLIPADLSIGILSAQALALFGLYSVGLAGAIGSAWLLNKLMPKGGNDSFVLEIPPYQVPHIRNLGIVVFQKAKAFVVEAGKIILAISIILWFLASFGPGNAMEDAEKAVLIEQKGKLEGVELANMQAAAKLEASYAGRMGKWIEPALSPMGFDWKIGVALISSFAAREVFVGTMSVLYAAGEEGEPSQIKERMLNARNPATGKPVFTAPVVVSLLIFYIFAMQCMSTLAVTYRETQSWRWPLYQLLYMTGLAVLFSTLAYQILS